MKKIMILIGVFFGFVFSAGAQGVNSPGSSAHLHDRIAAANAPLFLYSAINQKNVAMVKELLEQDKSLANTLVYLRNSPSAKMHPLLQAVGVGNFEIVELLVNAGADINYELRRFRHETRGFTPASFAIRVGNVKILEYLLSKGAKCYGVMSSSPLQLAIRSENQEMIAFVKQHCDNESCHL